MAQLIAIGNMIINLDQIAVLDIDPVVGRNDIVVVRVHGTSAKLTEVFMTPAEAQRLIGLVPTKFGGSDDSNS